MEQASETTHLGSIIKIVIMALLGFILCSTQQPKSRLVAFTYSSQGMTRLSCESLEARLNTDSVSATITIDADYPSEIVIKKAPASVLADLEKIVEKHKMDKYKGSYRPEKGMSDGESWSLYLKYIDGTEVHASGASLKEFREVSDYFKKYRKTK